MARVLDRTPAADVVADCGRLYSQAPTLDVLRNAAGVLLVTRPTIDGVGHLRTRLASLAGELRSAAPDGVPLFVVVITAARDDKSPAEIELVLRQSNIPATVVGRIGYDPAGAGMITGEWVGRLDKSLLIRSAREVARRLAGALQPRRVGV
jgi:hypothetical protein